ncbi:MAG: ATP-binding protein [Aquisalinus sp.]|nr:ATP-binding protein [Aquisalinus sp.]
MTENNDQSSLLSSVLEQPAAFEKSQRLARVGHAMNDVRRGCWTASDMLWNMLGLPPQKKPVVYESRREKKLLGPYYDEIIRMRRACIESRTAQTHELHAHNARTGKAAIFRLEFHPELDDDHYVDSFFLIFSDVTHQRRLEDRLKNERATLARAQQVARVGHFFHDLSDHTITGSEMLWDILGIDPEHSPATYDEAAQLLFDDQTLETSLARREQLLNTGEDIKYEIKLPRADTGEIRYFRVQIHPEKNQDDMIVRFFGVVADITEQKLLEVELRYQQELSLKAQEVGRVGHFYNDYASKSLFWSDTVYDIFGIEERAPHLLGTDRLRPALMPGEAEKFEAEGRRVVDMGGASFSYTFHGKRPNDGKVIFVQSDCTIEYANGRVKAILGFLQDITERVEAQNTREKLEAALQEAQKSEALNYFAGGMAHELSNMLQPAISFGTLAKSAASKGDSKTAEKHISEALNAINRATDLTRKALQFVRNSPVSGQSISIISALAEARSILRASSGNIRWDLSAELYGLCIHAETTGFVQILLNLVRNAIEASGSNERVEITAEKHEVTDKPFWQAYELTPGKYIKVCVRDFGPGISSDISEDIFNPMFTTKSGGMGTGLGLPVSKGLAERWGGALILNDDNQHGAEFWLLLPITD